MNVGLINRMTLFYAHEMRHACSFEVPGVAVLWREPSLARWTASVGAWLVLTTTDHGFPLKAVRSLFVICAAYTLAIVGVCLRTLHIRIITE